MIVARARIPKVGVLSGHVGADDIFRADTADRRVDLPEARVCRIAVAAGRTLQTAGIAGKNDIRNHRRVRRRCAENRVAQKFDGAVRRLDAVFAIVDKGVVDDRELRIDTGKAVLTIDDHIADQQRLDRAEGDQVGAIERIVRYRSFTQHGALAVEFDIGLQQGIFKCIPDITRQRDGRVFVVRLHGDVVDREKLTFQTAERCPDNA